MRPAKPNECNDITFRNGGWNISDFGGQGWDFLDGQWAASTVGQENNAWEQQKNLSGELPFSRRLREGSDDPDLPDQKLQLGFGQRHHA